MPPQAEMGVGSQGDNPGFGGHAKAGASGLDIFSGPEIEPYLTGRKEVFVYPNTGVQNSNGPFKFEVISDGDKYIDLSATRLFGQFKVLKMDGSDIDLNERVALCNLGKKKEREEEEEEEEGTRKCTLFLFSGPQAFWKEIQVEVNGNSLSTFYQAENMYKAYVETILSYSKNAQDTHLKLEHFEMDTAGRFDNFDAHAPSRHYRPAKDAVVANANVNPPVLAEDAVLELTGREGNEERINMGWHRRRELIAGSKSVQFDMPLHSDFFHAERYLPPGLSFSVVFVRKTPDDFVFMYPTPSAADRGKYKIKFERLQLRLSKLSVEKTFMLKHRLYRAQHNARYFTSATITKEFSIAVGIKSHIQPSFFRGYYYYHHHYYYYFAIFPPGKKPSPILGVLPNQLIIGFLDARAWDGDPQYNPFNFQHFDVRI